LKSIFCTNKTNFSEFISISTMSSAIKYFHHKLQNIIFENNRQGKYLRLKMMIPEYQIIIF